MDNPQAFPGYRYNATTDGVEQVGNQTYRSPGITLRDYFAASIIAGLYVSYGGNAPEPEQMAEDAYAIADAMIAARATQQQEG